MRISKYKNIFAKGFMANWSEEVYSIKKVKNTVPWTYVVNDLNGEEIKGKFYEKELQKTNKKNSEQKKQFKKGNELYLKWRGHNNAFNSWIEKKDFV